ncbi:hypothetical protein QCE63_04665 [Caballeronia sp. LZ065]|nr:hypothetical protein [Caballeronia sp. LZ065]
MSNARKVTNHAVSNEVVRVRNVEGGRLNSKLVYNGDPGNTCGAKGATEPKYGMDAYDPKTETQDFSCTSGRVAQRVYKARRRPEPHVAHFRS